MPPLLLAALLLAPAADPPKAEPQAVPATRPDFKRMLEDSKKATPRLPMPPADPSNPQARANNGRFRAHYLPADLRDSGFSREPDPAMTLDNTFKVKLFWIASRVNNCVY